MAVWERGTVCGCVVMHSMTSIMSLSTLIEEQRSMMPLLSLSLCLSLSLLSLSFCSSRRRVCLMLLAQLSSINIYLWQFSVAMATAPCQAEVLDQKAFNSSFHDHVPFPLITDYLRIFFSFLLSSCFIHSAYCFKISHQKHWKEINMTWWVMFDFIRKKRNPNPKPNRH